MTYEIRCRCGGEITFSEIEDVPPPPFPTMPGQPPPDQWRGWRWICQACGADTGVTYDYGTLDLGIVRDSQLTDRPFMEVEIFDE